MDLLGCDHRPWNGRTHASRPRLTDWPAWGGCERHRVSGPRGCPVAVAEARRAYGAALSTLEAFHRTTAHRTGRREASPVPSALVPS